MRIREDEIFLLGTERRMPNVTKRMGAHFLPLFCISTPCKTGGRANINLFQCSFGVQANKNLVKTFVGRRGCKTGKT